MAYLVDAVRAADHAFIFDNSGVGPLAGGPRLVARLGKTSSNRISARTHAPTPEWVAHFLLHALEIEPGR
jgi:hypothetical protein